MYTYKSPKMVVVDFYCMRANRRKTITHFGYYDLRDLGEGEIIQTDSYDDVKGETGRFLKKYFNG